MFTIDRARALAAVTLLLFLAAVVHAQVPDVTGTYQGVFDFSVSNCVPPEPPSSDSATGPLQFHNQNGALFTITGSFDAPVDPCEIDFTGSGTVNAQGSFTGNCTYSFYCDNILGAAGSGTLTGFVSGTLVNMQVVGMVSLITGQTCQVNGLFAGLCSVSCPNNVLGACCFDSETCLALNDATCASTGGDFEGGATTCAATDCPVVCPGVPTGLIATDGTQANWVLMTWIAAADADEYQIWRGINGQGGSQAIGFSTNGALWYTDSTAVPGVVYKYWVRARNDGCWSTFGPPDTGYIATVAPPAAPNGFVATDGTQEAYVLMSWLAAPTATQYQVWRAEAGDPFASLGTSNNGALWYTDLTAVPGVVYDYAVRASNGSAWGPLSTSDSGFRPAPCPADVDASGEVGFSDLTAVLQGWGPCTALGSCPADVNLNGDVGFADLSIVLGAWGVCE